MGHSLNIVNLTGIGASPVVVLDACPLSVFDVLYKGFHALVNAQSDNSYVLTPVCSSLFQHLLIVSHWLLAGRTPCGPKIKKPNFSFLVFEAYGFSLSKRHNVFNSQIFVSSQNLGVHIDFRIADFLRILLNSLAKLGNLIGLISANIMLN